MIVALAAVVYFQLLIVVYVQNKYPYRDVYGFFYTILLPIGGIILIAWAIIPRSDPFRVVGVRLSRNDQPRIFALLDGVALATRQRSLSDVYIVPDINAWVTQCGGVLGIGSRRVIGIGLPLLGVLNVSQLRAILVHEFGHYYGGDTALGPLVYATRSVIARTLQALEGENSFLNVPFELYGDLFLHLTRAVSRQQEWSADELACRVVGSGAFAEGLRLINSTALVEKEYWQTQIDPIVSNGYLPPLAEGFRRFVTAPPIAEALAKRAALVLEKEEESPVDSHPVTRDRLARAGAMWPRDTKGCALPAILLIDGVSDVEARLLVSTLGPKRANALRPIDWQEVGAKVYVAEWDGLRKKHAAVLAGMKADFLANLRANVLAVADDLGIYLNYEERAKRQVAEILGECLACALVRNGWTVQVLPGPQIICQHGTSIVEPIDIIHRLISGELTGNAAWEWARWCAAYLTNPMPV
jgi:Zn-dependent protease with chaperone function